VRVIRWSVLAIVGTAIAAARPGHAESLPVLQAYPWMLVDAASVDDSLTLRQVNVARGLQDCAMGWGSQGDSGACVRVATILAARKVPLHRFLRRVVREGRSPGGVVEASAALAAMPDRDSGDLYLWAILEGRGGDAAVPHLLDAWQRVQPRWAVHYLRFLAEFAPTPLSRALAAERALFDRRPRDSHLPYLLMALEAVELPGSAGDRFGAMARQIRVDCDLSALAESGKERTCRHKPMEVQASTAPPLADAGCLAAGRPDIRRRDEVRRVASACAAVLEPEAFYLRTGLGRRFRVTRVAVDDARVTEGDDAGRAPVRKKPLPAGPVPILPAETVDPSAFPPDFWGFDPRHAQPAWYPAHLHLTIDDGPRPNTINPALDVLDRYGVKVLFFFVGDSLVRRHAEDPAALRVLLGRTLASGHGVGYHSMGHETEPDVHESEREPDQFADSVALFRGILNRLAGVQVPVIYGRFPGGRGAFHAEMPELYAAAGLMQHVFWNFGPGFWQADTPVWVVRGMACELATAPRSVTVLLHEFARLAGGLEALLSKIRDDCPADRQTSLTDPRTVWRKDYVFMPSLCGSDHPDARRVCDQWAAEKALRKNNLIERGQAESAGGRGQGAAMEQPTRL